MFKILKLILSEKGSVSISRAFWPIFMKAEYVMLDEDINVDVWITPEI
jgi:ribosomal protein L31E